MTFVHPYALENLPYHHYRVAIKKYTGVTCYAFIRETTTPVIITAPFTWVRDALFAACLNEQA